jgi:hypothetical protein
MNTGSIATDLGASIDRDLAGRICVRPPYFSLRDISWSGGEFSALASAEFPTSLEVGPMQAAERGRHGAIAGLCALAMSQPDSARRYYLAQKAHYRAYFSRANYGASIRFSARVDALAKRSGRATINATVLGSSEKVMDLSVEYLVLTEPMFERLFRDHRQAIPSGSQLALPHALRTAPGVRTVPALPASLCRGHFENYPALPLAIVLRELVDMSGEVFAAPYWVHEALVSADDLCWAGQTARFEVASETQPSTADNHSKFLGRALRGPQMSAELKLTLASPG